MKTFFTIVILLFAITTFSQQLSQVSFSIDGRLLYFTISTDDGVLLRVSPEGQLKEWGTEEASLYNNNYYAPNLRPYLGRIEYFGDEADSALRGKVKYIGSTAISWYAQYEVAIKVGRLKLVNNILTDYYDNFSVPGLQGKLKSIGDQAFDYYSLPSDDEAFRGKLKSINNLPVTYFSSFDDRQLRGKIKSIGSVAYDWYTSYDLNRSGLKTGLYRNQINGITFIIR